MSQPDLFLAQGIPGSRNIAETANAAEVPQMLSKSTIGTPVWRQLPDGRFEVVLSGCATRPLAHYLKALGVLRLIAEQKDDSATGHWRDDQFVLTSSLTAIAIQQFFLQEYRPTPVCSPWNGGSGFYVADNREALQRIENTTDERLADYQRTVAASREAMDRAGYTSEGKSKANDKRTLIQACRNLWPDSALAWLDAAVILTNDDPRYPPLLGTGGNDGRLDFSNNFMQRMLTVLFDGVPTAEQLRTALFGISADVLQSKSAIGQFFPSAAGGANKTTGFDSESLTNPWDFVLMIEGALLMAASAVRQMPTDERGAISAPFTVRNVAAGYGGANENDSKAARAELWLPLWNEPMSFGQLELLFSEGRISTGKGAARDGLDALAALSQNAFIRGLQAFERYGLMERNGLAYFATPLGRIPVRSKPSSTLLGQTQWWCEHIFRHTADENTPLALSRAVRTLKAAVFELEAATEPDLKARERGLIEAIAELNTQMAVSFRWTSKGDSRGAKRQHAPLLDAEWLRRISDGSAEFWLAASLASIATSTREKIASSRTQTASESADAAGQVSGESRLLDFRPYFAPVDTQRSLHRQSAVSWLENPGNDQVWTRGRVVPGLLAILHRRILQHTQHHMHAWEWPADRQGNVHDDVDAYLGYTAAPLWAIERFVDGQIDDSAFERWLRCCLLVRPGFDLRRGKGPQLPGASGPGTVPKPSWALAKLAFAGMPVPFNSEGVSASALIKLTPTIAASLAAGNGEQGMRLAIQRLRSAGLPLLPLNVVVSDHEARRIAASLLFPLEPNAIREHVLQSVLRPVDALSAG